MTDEPPSTIASIRNNGSGDKTERSDKSWLKRLRHALNSEPRSREELLAVIKEAANNQLLDQDALTIIEGALDVASQQARELMVPRSQVVAIRVAEKIGRASCRERV